MGPIMSIWVCEKAYTPAPEVAGREHSLVLWPWQLDKTGIIGTSWRHLECIWQSDLVDLGLIQLPCWMPRICHQIRSCGMILVTPMVKRIILHDPVQPRILGIGQGNRIDLLNWSTTCQIQSTMQLGEGKRKTLSNQQVPLTPGCASPREETNASHLKERWAMAWGDSRLTLQMGGASWKRMQSLRSK